MKKIVPLLLLTALLLMPAAIARAGWNPLDVAADGKGVAVYTSSAGTRQAGVLYNGYSDELSLEATDGLYSCDLTTDYTVWLNQRKAEKNQPDANAYGWYSSEWDEKMPCEIFVAEVVKENAPLYTTPGHKRLSAKHALGTLVKVCGEFGDDYFVVLGGYDQRGFMPRSALRKVQSVTYAEANRASKHWGLSDAYEAAVYTGATPLAVGASATGYSDAAPAVLKDGYTVMVLKTLGDWAQLADGYFIEARFLNPDGDHSVTYATVKTSGIANRLNVRAYADADAWVRVKLCSGVQVQVPSHTDEWAAVFVTGPSGGYQVSGSVQMQYLAFGDEAAQVKSGCVRVRLKDALYVYNSAASGEEKSWTANTILPAGTEMTVIGVNHGYDIENNDADLFLCLLSDGTALEVWNDNGGILEPLESLGVTAKATSDVRLRISPDKEAKVLRTLSKGAKVEVLLRGEGWTMVKYKDQTGYVMSRYLQFP